MSKWWGWDNWITYKSPYKEGWAYILRKDHRTFRLVPFDPRYTESFEFEGHKYCVVPELMVRLRRYDPRLDNAHVGFFYMIRWFTPKKIGMLKYKEFEEGVKYLLDSKDKRPIILPEDHIEVIEEHEKDDLNPLRFKITILEQLANAAFRSIKQTQPINKKWMIALIVIMIGVAALVYLMFGGGATVHAP